ncbi:MAG: NAD(P)-binding domain-containing protein, partial [Myxococcota bacterium]
MNPIASYYHWLHGRWPAGLVEKMPEVGDDGATRLEGVRIVGDLTGIPLLKFSADTGAKAVLAFMREPGFSGGGEDSDLYDVAIIGAGVSGMSAALEAKKAGLRYIVFEAAERFNTIVNFPKAKPIYTYPTEMIPAGDIQFGADVKEALIEELETQTAGIDTTPARIDRVERAGGELKIVHAGDGDSVTRAKRVVIAIGRSGNYRRLGVPGEDLDKVYHRLYDPAEYTGKHVLVVGGGDSALEAAIALAQSGAKVTLSYRKKEFNRPKPDNIEKLEALERDPDMVVDVAAPTSDRVGVASGSFMGARPKGGTIDRLMASKLQAIREDDIEIVDADGVSRTVANDVVFAMIGREAPLDFFRRSKIPITGEWRASTWAGFLAFFAFCVFVYHWKSGGSLTQLFAQNGWFPNNVPGLLKSWFAAAAQDKSTLVGTLAITLKKPGFYYTLAYTTSIVLFGIDRIRRRRTPYITAQTLSLMSFQALPLFLLPYIILPWMGHNGVFDSGFMKTAADNLFPVVGYDHGREYWRAFGLVLAWPLFVWNFFTHQPMTWWLVIGGIQTFVAIPLLVYFFGKGAYCGWVCSCGALAETLGDRHRQKMPHGPFWNKVNMVGQVLLAWCFVMLGARILAWTMPGSALGRGAESLFQNLLSQGSLFGLGIFNYQYLVDLWIAGVVGVAFYFWYSGRVWCRFACPLAALMHIYARFSQFRI